MDRTSKKILKELIHSKKGTEYVCVFDPAWESFGDIEIEAFAKLLKRRTEDVRAAVRFLEAQGFLEYQRGNGRNVGFHLSHMGLNWRYFQRKQRLDYIADKWPDFIALIISILSLITSVIALTKPQ